MCSPPFRVSAHQAECEEASDGQREDRPDQRIARDSSLEIRNGGREGDNGGGPRHDFQPDGVDAAQVPDRRLVLFAFAVLPDTDCLQDEKQEGKQENHILNYVVEAVPVPPRPHPIVAGKEHRVNDFGSRHFFYGNV